MSTKKITIIDVARLAGVSYQTVSRVINNRPDVADETRQKVKQVIGELGYHPSAAARSLASNKTSTLGLITSDFSEYFFTQVIAGAEAEARQHGYAIILGSTERNPSDEPEYFRLLIEQRVEGILYVRPSFDSEPHSQRIGILLNHNIPLVATAYYDHNVTTVDVDNLKGGIQATQYLIEAGHRSIGMITGPAGYRSTYSRTEGYRLALEGAGIHYNPLLVEQGDWFYESGYQALKRLLAKAPHITAVFAQSDQMAIAAMRALHEAGWTIPDDMSVVGYDDIPVAAYCYPPLTTIRQPMRGVGQVAVRLLIEAIDNPPVETQQLLLEPMLIVRDSASQKRNIHVEP